MPDTIDLPDQYEVYPSTKIVRGPKRASYDRTLVHGIIDTAHSRGFHNMKPARLIKPNDIADVYWHLSHQPKSTWTQELDLRPQSESF